MAKKTTEDDLGDNLFGKFKFMDQPVPKDTNKAPEKKEDESAEETKIRVAAEAEAKALAEAAEAAEKAKAKKTAKETVEAEEDEPEAEEDEDQEEDKVEDTESPLSIFAKDLSEKGLLDLEDTDKIESDEDLYKVYNRTIEKAIAEDRTGRPEDAQKFLEYLDNGGRPEDFHKLYYGDGGSFEDFTIETEEDQEHVVREGLMLEGYTEEEANDEIADLKDLNKLDKKATIQLKKLQKIEKDQKRLLLDSQKEFARKQQEARAADWADFKKGLFNKEEISGFKFNDKMKTDTWDYMTKIVNKKEGLTQYQIDSATNPDARYMFAYLLKNKWDIKALEKQVTTKAVSKLASKLNNYTDTRTKIAKGTPAKEKAEDTANPFSAWKSAL